MAIWIQSLSWTLIYSLGHGFLVYVSLWLVLKLVPSASSNAKYHLSLSALTILLLLFVSTLWQQFHSLTLVNESLASHSQQMIVIPLPISTEEGTASYYSFLSRMTVLLPWLSVGYMIGLMFMLLRLSAGMLQLLLLRKSGITQPDTAFDQLLVSLKDRIHYNGSVQLVISAKAQLPIVIGFFKPMILMPVAALAQLSTEQLETIVLRELAHIKRYDYLVNILQTVVETILFFNPFVWMISAVTRREREHCCDDLVMDHTREPLFYATALATLASQPGTASSFAVAATGRSNHLFNRIKRIIEMKKNPFSYSRMVAAILIFTVFIGSAVWMTPSFAQSRKDKPAIATSSSKPVEMTPVMTKEQQANQQEANQLVQRLIADNVVDQVKGFLVEKRDNKLYINGVEQSGAIANKYLPMTKQEVIKVQVFSLSERMRQHPGADFLQILVPVTFSSGCVDYDTKKPGC